MRPWVIPATVFLLGTGLGLSGPMLATRYLDSYLPAFLKDTMHPLEGSVTHKQRQEDQLLVTMTTQDGSILATFQQRVPEIDLLIEERDLVTLDVPQYKPFVHDPTLIRVTKHTEMNPAVATPPNTSVPSTQTKESGSMNDSPGFVPLN
ncbi:MAG: hypothetical protein NPIRA03_08260 [Nitrospirales bacterium]|nr:MAG: hypothetical protein NPIRA03_08260 [Nitrospirales bacterium]